MMGRRARAIIRLFGVIAIMVFSMLILSKMFTGDSFLEYYGLVGIFLSALFSHLTVIARGLFLPLFLSSTQFYNPLILGFVAGLGGALGEIIVYYWGSGIKEFLGSNRQGGKHLSKQVERYSLLIALIFASSPLPDTPIMLLAGLLRLPLWKLVLIQVIGKTTLYSVGAAVGGFIFMELKSAFEEIIASIIVLAASIALCVIISWSRSRNTLLKILNKVLSKLGVKASFYI